MSTADSLLDAFTSPNEQDRNGETANVVDGLFAIARALDRLAKAIRDSGEAPGVEIPG